ncbi:hypothetical protein QUF70_09320 [Desulfobacterales bacterium HSG17]|nr:hypothetical protein [Desulfobacterales bacterium HSG17]
MRKFLYLMIFLAISFNSYADILHLTDGRTLTCEQWWKEGNNIKYTFFGATVSIPELKVVKIEKTERQKPKPTITDIPQKTISDDDAEESNFNDDEGECKYLLEGLFLSNEGHHIFISTDCINGFLNSYIKVKDGKERSNSTIFITYKNNEGRTMKISSELEDFGGSSTINVEQYLKRCTLYKTNEKWKAVRVYLR